MGLDMYAARRLYVKQWEHQSPDERYTVQIAHGGKPVSGIQSDRISDVDEEVMYWRKANHIHGWFVDNVQNGEDDCKPYHVNWNRLRELHSVCAKVIEASKLVDGMVYDGTVYRNRIIESLDNYGLSEAAKADITQEINDLDFDDEYWIISQIRDFECDGFQFQDVWEIDMKTFSYHFIWCCYAIAWGIQQYDSMKGETND